MQLRLRILLERRLQLLVELGMQPEMLPVFLVTNGITNGQAFGPTAYSFTENPASAAGFSSWMGEQN